MALTSGRPGIRIGLVDGPVKLDHPDLESASIQPISTVLSSPGAPAAAASGAARRHGTFVAGILAARRGTAAPAICPRCTLLVRAIFQESAQQEGELPASDPGTLARAIRECVEAGARILNLSVALSRSTSQGERQVEESLDYAAKRGVIVVAAAGNDGSICSSSVTRHPVTIPVVGYDSHGRPVKCSNLGISIGRRGIGAPGEGITSLDSPDEQTLWGGTSVAAPFVSGAIALLRGAPARLSVPGTARNGARIPFARPEVDPRRCIADRGRTRERASAPL